MAVPRELQGGTSCPFRGMWGSPSCADGHWIPPPGADPRVWGAEGRVSTAVGGTEEFGLVLASGPCCWLSFSALFP